MAVNFCPETSRGTQSRLALRSLPTAVLRPIFKMASAVKFSAYPTWSVGLSLARKNDLTKAAWSPGIAMLLALMFGCMCACVRVVVEYLSLDRWPEMAAAADPADPSIHTNGLGYSDSGSDDVQCPISPILSQQTTRPEPVTPCSRPITRSHSPTMSYTQLKSAKVHHTDVNPSPANVSDTVVFVHGLGSSQNFYIPLTYTLKKENRRFILLDLPGAARSPLPIGEAPTVQSLAAILLELLEHLEVVQNVTVVGHSMGCLVALHVAHLAPEKITGLVLLGPVYPSAGLAEVFEKRISAVKKGGYLRSRIVWDPISYRPK